MEAGSSRASPPKLGNCECSLRPATRFRSNAAARPWAVEIRRQIIWERPSRFGRLGNGHGADRVSALRLGAAARGCLRRTGRSASIQFASGGVVGTGRCGSSRSCAPRGYPAGADAGVQLPHAGQGVSRSRPGFESDRDVAEAPRETTETAAAAASGARGRFAIAAMIVGARRRGSHVPKQWPFGAEMTRRVSLPPVINVPARPESIRLPLENPL